MWSGLLTAAPITHWMRRDMGCSGGGPSGRQAGARGCGDGTAEGRCGAVGAKRDDAEFGLALCEDVRDWRLMRVEELNRTW